MENNNQEKVVNKKLRICLIVVFLIVIAIVAVYVRKLVIFDNLQSNLDVYKNSTNYYMKVTQYSEGYVIVNRKFQKDDKFMESHLDISISNQTMNFYKIYGDNDGVANFYYVSDNGEVKQLEIQEEDYPVSEIPDYFEEDRENTFEYLKMVLFSSITTEEYNEKDCYKITKNLEDNVKEYIYIEKETGLVLRDQMSTSRSITDYDYSFNVVTDETIEEPTVSE